MKKLAIKTYGKIVTFTIAFLGIIIGNESCVMYGTPSADFIIRGKVTDVNTNQPIPKIRIVVPFLHSADYGDTVYTNLNGEYVVKQNDFPIFSEPRRVLASDVDGEENGLYLSDTLEFSFTKNDRIKRGSGSWYEGTFEKKNQNFSLKKVEAIPMYGVMPAKFDEQKEKS